MSGQTEYVAMDSSVPSGVKPPSTSPTDPPPGYLGGPPPSGGPPPDYPGGPPPGPPPPGGLPPSYPGGPPPGYPGGPPPGYPVGPPPGYAGQPPPGYPYDPSKVGGAPPNAYAPYAPPPVQVYAYPPPGYGQPIYQVDLLGQPVAPQQAQELDMAVHISLIVLSVAFPLAGWIIFCMFISTHPKTAQACCWAASITVGLIFVIVLIVIFAALG